MRNNINTIIFDMDGVIVDSEPIHAKAEQETCLAFGINVPAEEWEHFRGKKLEDIFTFASQTYGTGQEPIERMIAHKIELYLSYALGEMKLIPGVRGLLTYIKDRSDLRCALTTSGRRIQQDQILAKFGLADFFEVIVTADDVQNGKPNPEPYLVTTEKLQEVAAQCLVIEDSDNGVLSAKAAGCQVCGITTTFPKERLVQAGADMVISDFGELKKMLEQKPT
jgi:beta-phosphoglucomutase